ncbi:MAG: nucleotidyltransferase family protein [Acidobacteriaceae bacterium]
MVFHTLRASLTGPPSPGCEVVLAELQQLSISSAHRTLLSLAELRRVVQEFRANNITVRVLKGIPLAQSVFGDLSLRSPGDIDLLIDESSILKADRVLRGFGYRGLLRIDRFSPKRLAFYRSHWKDLAYRNPATGFEVDLHWRCFRNSQMPGAGLCAACGQEGVAFGGFRVDTLPRMEGLLYLCVHGTLDGWLYLKSLVDVAAQVRTMSELQLDELANLAAGYGILPELTATLILVRRYLSIDHWSQRLLPPDDRTVKHILRYAGRTLVRGGFLADRDSIPIAATIAFELSLRRNFRYRRELLVRVFYRARMWETIPLPDSLFWLYPLLSPFEWLTYRVQRRAGEAAL